MPWCPECNTEYQAGGGNCTRCSAQFAAELPTEAIPISTTEGGEDSDLVFLTFASDDVAADIIIVLLKENGIPVYKRLRGSMDHIKLSFHSPMFGSDLFVPSTYLEKGRELVAELEEQSKPVTQEEVQAEQKARQYADRRRIWVWILLIALLPFLWTMLRSGGWSRWF